MVAAIKRDQTLADTAAPRHRSVHQLMAPRLRMRHAAGRTGSDGMGPTAIATGVCIFTIAIGILAVTRGHFAHPAYYSEPLPDDGGGVQRGPAASLPRCPLNDLLDVTKATWVDAPEDAAVLQPVMRRYPDRCPSVQWCSAFHGALAVGPHAFPPTFPFAIAGRIRKNYHINTTYYRKGTTDETKRWYEGLEKVQRAFVRGKPLLVPPGALNRSCAVGYASALGPFPRGARVLFVGNSQLNQVAQSIACRFADRVVARWRRRIGPGACGTCHLEIDTLYPNRNEANGDDDPCVRVRRGAAARAAPSEAEEGPSSNNVAEGLDERTPIYRFANGAELATIINSPVFYVKGHEPEYDVPRRVARLLLGAGDLRAVTHVVWHRFNGRPWGGHHFRNVCPGMERDRASGNFFQEKKYGVVMVPDIATIADQIAALKFTGTLLMSESAVGGARACATAREKYDGGGDGGGGMRVHCWDPVQRWRGDRKSAWDCSLDRKYYHQCMPGPVDAMADWLLWMIAAV